MEHSSIQLLHFKLTIVLLEPVAGSVLHIHATVLKCGEIALFPAYSVSVNCYEQYLVQNDRFDCIEIALTIIVIIETEDGDCTLAYLGPASGELVEDLEPGESVEEYKEYYIRKEDISDHNEQDWIGLQCHVIELIRNA